MIRYHVEPDFDVGQLADQRPPETVVATVSLALLVSRTLIGAVVEALVRMFTGLHAGTIIDDAADT